MVLLIYGVTNFSAKVQLKKDTLWTSLCDHAFNEACFLRSMNFLDLFFPNTWRAYVAVGSTINVRAQGRWEFRMDVAAHRVAHKDGKLLLKKDWK